MLHSPFTWLSPRPLEMLRWMDLALQSVSATPTAQLPAGGGLSLDPGKMAESGAYALAIIVVLLITGGLVPGPFYRDMKKDRDSLAEANKAMQTEGFKAVSLLSDATQLMKDAAAEKSSQGQEQMRLLQEMRDELEQARAERDRERDTPEKAKRPAARPAR